MDAVITQITEHEGGAMDRCHHQANSWRLKPLQQLGDYTHTLTHTHTHSHTLTHTYTHSHTQTVHKNYLHLHWKRRVAGADRWCQWCSRQTPGALWQTEPNSEHGRSSLSHTVHTIIQIVWECDLLHLLSSSCVFLSRWRPRPFPQSSHMRRIETLMEPAVLLCELLLCSFPNGEKFNYQLICCVVSGDMKFPIVSAPIKCPALTPLSRNKE